MAVWRITLCIIVLIIATINCHGTVHNELFDAVGNFVQSKQFSEFSHFRNDAIDEDAECRAQFSTIVNALPAPWALEVIDAWGKIPSGIFYGNLNDFGNFDQCLGIRYALSPDNLLEGQYCRANLPIDLKALLQPDSKFTKIETNLANVMLPHTRSLDRAMPPPNQGGEGFNIGLCVPNTCSEAFVADLINNSTDLLIDYITSNLPVTLPPDFPPNFIVTCFPQGPNNYSAADIFGITFFSFFGALMVFSTGYDLVMKALNKEPIGNLLAFSVYTNGEKLFKCKRTKSPEVMECLNGIRVLSIVWVVFGHTYFMFIFIPMTNKIIIMEWIKTMYAMLLIGATLAVDSFFLLSGLLVAWSMLRHLDKKHGRINVFMMYFHRYLRLTPSLAAAILFYVTIYKYLGSGPVRNILNYTLEDCEYYWPYTLLYIQNYVNPANICLGHSWYLSVDMQLFILSPLILYPLWRWRNKFIGVIPILIVLSMACTFTVYMINDGFIGLEDLSIRMQKTYFKTHNRYGPYLIGILLGYLLHNLKGKGIILSRRIVTFGWFISLGAMLTIIFAAYNLWNSTNPTALEYAFQESFHRVSWAICLAWIIFACVTGYGGPVNWFLSLPQWQPLSKLSYSLYIVHFPFQLVLAASIKTPLYFSNFDTIHRFWGDFGLALSIALLWTLAFESPIVTLEKMIFGKSPSPQTTTKKSEEAISNGHKA